MISPPRRLSGFRLREYRKTYSTPFGLTERTHDRYSTIVAEVVAERTTWRVAVDYFIGYTVCVLLCLFGYFVPPGMLQVRTTLATSATFAVVGNAVLVAFFTWRALTAVPA